MTMRRSPLTRTLVVLLLAGALVATPTSAEARQYVHQDPRGDMDETSKSGWPAAPDQVNGDIIRMRAWHTPKRVRVRLVFAELKPGADVWISTHFRFWSNKNNTRDLHVEVYPGHWQGTYFMTRFRDGARLRCAVHRSFDYTHNVAVVGFSRRCVNNPRWVQISAASSTAFWDGSGMAWPPSYADNAQRTNLATSTYLNPSPRIRRG